MDRQRLDDLLKRYRKGKCTPEELEEIENWYEQLGVPTNKPPVNSGSPEANDYVHRRYQALEARIRKNHTIRRVLPLVAAAVITGAVIGGAAFFLLSQQQAREFPQQAAVLDVKPGSDRATLTLSNGKTLRLDSLANGSIALQGEVQAVTANGTIAYSGFDKSSQVPTYNILSTPRGGTFRIRLPDGTSVWLNAATTLRFPIAYPGNERKVELTGEAYFEVAHNATKPFIVVTAGQEVKVLGTRFTISSYAEESKVQTTLLQGRVAVQAAGNKVTLAPGQGAILENGILSTAKVDTSISVAWKEGVLDFSGLSFPQVMRQIARWYDVEIIYQNGMPTKKLSGQMDREMTLPQLVEGLRAMGLDITLEGKKLLIKS